MTNKNSRFIDLGSRAINKYHILYYEKNRITNRYYIDFGNMDVQLDDVESKIFRSWLEQEER